MYLLEFDRVYDTKVLDKTYEWLESTGLLNKTFIIYNIDKDTDNINKYKTHFIGIKLNQFKEIDDIIDILMSISFNQKNLIVDISDTDYDTICEFNRNCKTLGVKYKVVGKESLENVSLTTPSKTDLHTIKEILNHYDYINKNEYMFSINDFLIRFRLTNDGKIYNQLGKKVGNIKRSNIYNIFLKLNSEHLSMIKETYSEIKETEDLTGLEIGLAEPWYFLGNTDNLIEDILEYKYRVFSLIKNIELENFNSLGDEVKKVLSESRYLPLDVIMKVENRNNELFEKDWFIQALQHKN